MALSIHYQRCRQYDAWRPYQDCCSPDGPFPCTQSCTAFHSHHVVLYRLLNIPFHLYPLCSLLFDQASTFFLWGGCDAVNFIDGPHGVDAQLHLLQRCDGVGAAANFIGVESSTRGVAALAAPQTLFVPAEPWERMHVCITFYCSATLSSVGRWILWHGTIRGS